MKEIAILMAAGLGDRMRPLTCTTAKPLVKVNGVSLIETVISALEKRRSISDIYVVTGYKAEQFEALVDVHDRIRLVYNADYATKNNINSVAVVADKMKDSDCFICEADLFVANDMVFCRELPRSGYFGKMVKGCSDDWVFDTDAVGRITRIGKCGKDCFNMVGISYFKAIDAARIAAAILSDVKKPENSQLFWDEVVDRLVKSDELDLVVHEVMPNEIVECDTVEDLEKFARSVATHENSCNT